MNHIYVKNKHCVFALILFSLISCTSISEKTVRERVYQFSLNELTDKNSIGIYLIGDDCYCPPVERYEVEIDEKSVFVNVRSYKFLTQKIGEDSPEINFKHSRFRNDKQVDWQSIELPSRENSIVFILFYDGKYRFISKKEAIDKMVRLDMLNERLKRQ